MKKTPAIVIKSEFTYSNSMRSFIGYLKYINREAAKENEIFKHIKDTYNKYIDYMADNKKNGKLFDEYEDYISLERKKEILEQFHQAEKADSPLWKDVISFDNEWLEEQGLYNSKTHWLNESKMKNVVREAISTMIENEKMRMPIWIASFHYNTDNIHVHIATVDLEPSYLPKVQAINPKTKKPIYDDNGNAILQFRGMRKQSTIKKMKSAVISKIIDRTATFKRIDELIRDNARRFKEIDLHSNKKMKDLFYNAIENMPNDLKQWKYGYYTVNNARPFIDQISKLYVETYHKNEIIELMDILDEQVELSERLYGSESNHQEYKDNKLDELKRRLGNSVIAEMKKYYKNEYLKMNNENINCNISYKMQNGRYRYDFKPLNKASLELNRTIYLLKKAMCKTFHDYQTERNISEFDRMLEGN